jgi:hypothetical protein
MTCLYGKQRASHYIFSSQCSHKLPTPRHSIHYSLVDARIKLKDYFIILPKYLSRNQTSLYACFCLQIFLDLRFFYVIVNTSVPSFDTRLGFPALFISFPYLML